MSQFLRQPARKNSWPTALKLFLHSPDSGRFTRTVIPLLAAWLPVNAVDDVVPLLGQLDDPALPINFISAIWLIWKVNKYRKISS